MPRARQRRLLAAFALILALTPASHARQRRAAGDPGAFDYFLLSLSVAPGFCAISQANRGKDECRSLSEQAFRQTPLTIHGLWPNRANVSVNRQPQDCDGPPLGTLPTTLRTDLRRYMPGGPRLQRHEWRKHGTCSGLPGDAYFATAVLLTQHANETIGAAMRDQGMPGSELQISTLLDAVAARDTALASAIVVNCRVPRGGGRAVVDEIRITLSKDFSPIAASSVGMGQNSGCPQGKGLVPNVSR